MLGRSTSSAQGSEGACSRQLTAGWTVQVEHNIEAHLPLRHRPMSQQQLSAVGIGERPRGEY